MIFAKNCFFLDKTFDIYFSLNLSVLFIKTFRGFSVVKLPPFYLFKNFHCNYAFMLLSFYFFKSLKSHFIVFYSKLICLYYSKLKLKGLGFRAVQICASLCRFYFTSTNFFYLHVPKQVIAKIKIRRLFFISTDLFVLREVIIGLLLLKKLMVYRISGLLYPKRIITMKPGKKRF
jgi:hypothetical protein